MASNERLLNLVRLMARTYRQKLESDETMAYVEWCKGIPEAELERVFRMAQEQSPDYMPTGPKISAAWKSLASATDSLQAEQQWELCCNHVREYGEVTYQSDAPLILTGPGEYAFRQIGQRSGLVRVLDYDNKGMQFTHKRFIEAHNTHVETGGLLAPTREEARRLLKETLALAKGKDETA